MTCPDELTLAMYVDTELDAAARDRVRSHTAHCPRCAAAVRALDDEAVVIRDVLSEPGAETETVPPAVVSHVRRSAQRRVLGSFAAAIGLAAGALELGAVAVARLEPSALLEWLSPFHLSGQMNFLFRAAFYGAREGGAMLSTMMTTAAVTVATLMVLTVVLRLARGVARPAATGLLTWALLWSAVPSEALEIRRSGDVTVAASETVDETVVAMADTITVDGTIRGDLIAMSRRVRIRGTVEGNLFALAQQVEVDGEVHGAIFGFGQTVSTQGRADGSLYALGQTVSLAQGSHVEGDVMMFGADATVEGTVGRDVTAFGQRVGIEGHVGRGATVGGQRVVIASRARIGGPLTAYVPTAESVDVAAGATIGGGTDVRVVESEATRSRYLTGGFYLGQLLRLGAAFVTGLLLFWVAPGAAAVRFETPVAALKTLGVGFLCVVAIPAAALVAGVTIVGLPLAVLALGVWGAGLYLAKIVVAVFVGGTLVGGSGRQLAVTLLAGLVAVFVAVNLPFVGGVMSVVLTIVGVGILYTQLAGWYRRQPRPAQVLK